MNEQYALDFTAASARAEAGIERSASKADRVLPGWTDRAAELLRDAVAHTDSGFTVEAVRVRIEHAIDPPPDLRAWGQVTAPSLCIGADPTLRDKHERHPQPATSA